MTEKHKGTENLIPVKSRALSELQEMGRKGGIASGESRRVKRRLCEALAETLTEQERVKICKALIKEAAKGNVRAFQLIRDSLGEKNGFDERAQDDPFGLDSWLNK